ncbi:MULTISPECIES: DUF2950 domain-containing protein [Cupriavidus]|uniref:DUF2950 domain-containing protein n=1 Tax=Cupriavidus TaxID=106589 RepID=UPI0037093CEF
MMRATMSATMKRTVRRFLGAAILAVPLLAVSAPALAQRVYPSPEAASDALGDAIARSDHDALKGVLGPNYRTLLPPQGVDQEDIYEFLAAWSRHHAVERAGEDMARVAVGESGWTFPVPIVKRKAGWQFDMPAGQREVHVRRIGRNELVTMDTLLQLADAQQRYAELVGNGRYATQLVSSPGKTNGLYWPSSSAENDSPLGPDALAMGPDAPPNEAFYGYRYRIIAAPKGSNAQYAIVAWPARYGDSGVNTFILDSERHFYERDLGASTASRAAALRTFSPEGWTKVAEQ